MGKSGTVRGVPLVAALVIAVTSGLIYYSYQQDIDRARARVAAGSQIADTRCGPIEYAVAGEGRPVLVVHGAGGGFDQGFAFAQPLIAGGFRVIAMSRFGYLRTPLPPDASPQAQADAHACLLDTLHIKQAAVIGVSAGAPSSIQFAIRHPQRATALVLLVPATFVPRPGAAASLDVPAGTQFLFETALKSDFLFWAAPRLARDTVIRAILATPPEVVERASPEEQARVQQVLDLILPVSARGQGLMNDAAITTALERYELERIRVPTLVISVADDLFGTYAAARYTAAKIPRARFVGYQNGGHLWVGHDDEVMTAIARFLRHQ